jgi:hypothetical protein
MKTLVNNRCVYCSEHGIQSLSSSQWEGEQFVCPMCKVKCEPELDLYNAFNNGCSYCGNKNIRSPFLYEEKLGKVFCYHYCHTGYIRKCIIHDCKMKASLKMTLVISDLERYLLGPVWCEDHSKNVPTKPDNTLWSAIERTFNVSGKPIPPRHECRIEFVEY